MGNLLLMEPIKEGAYTRAMTKRGPGLHHIAIDVLNLNRFIDELSGTGWLLHPKSLKTAKDTQTVWLSRPGVPALVEVQQRDAIKEFQPFITNLKLPELSLQNLKMFNHLGLNQIQSTAANNLSLVMNEKIIFLKDLVL